MSIPAIVAGSAGLCDTAPAVWSMTDRGLTARVRPTYVGTRKYMTDAGEISVLRRPSQVNSPGHLATLERLVGTRRHPSKAGRRVFLSTTATPGTPAPWDPSVELQPHKDYFVGSVGDKIDIVHVPGMGYVPELNSTINDKQTLADIRNGLHEVSYGYVGWFLKAEEVPVEGDVVSVGEWKNPETGMVEHFDLECLCDPTDPRVPQQMRGFIGGNHLAFAVPSGRGGPDIRMLLDEAVETLNSMSGKPVQAFALCRKVDESGVSGTGMVALVVTFEGGPAVSLWLTPTPSGGVYADLDTFKAVHIGNHADGANELVPMVIGLQVPDEAVEIEVEVEEPEEPAEELGTTGTPPQGDDSMENDPTKPNGGATNNAPPVNATPEELKAQLAAKSAEYESLLTKYNDLLKENNDLKAKMTEATDAKGAAMAKADSLLVELAPYRERELAAKRTRAVRALGATGTLADEINKANAVELPGIVVSAYYDANPNLRSVVDDLETKLKDGAYVMARFDQILEQHAVSSQIRGVTVSDDFRSALKNPPATSDNKPKSGQALLDSMQNGN